MQTNSVGPITCPRRHTYIAARDGRRRTFCPAARVDGGAAKTCGPFTSYVYKIRTIQDTGQRDNVAVSRARVYNIVTVRRTHTPAQTRARAHSEPDDSEKGRPSGFQRYLILFFFRWWGAAVVAAWGVRTPFCRRTAAGRPRATAVVRLTSNTSRTRSPASFNTHAHRRRQQVVRPFP